MLKVNKREIHPGTTYGVIGTVGSGKSTLLNILSGGQQQSSGVVLYDDKRYERNWLGRIVAQEEVFYSRYPEIHGSGQTVSSYISGKFEKKKNVLKIGILMKEALRIYGVVKLKEFPEVNFTGWE